MPNYTLPREPLSYIRSKRVAQIKKATEVANSPKYNLYEFIREERSAIRAVYGPEDSRAADLAASQFLRKAFADAAEEHVSRPRFSVIMAYAGIVTAFCALVSLPVINLIPGVESAHDAAKVALGVSAILMANGCLFGAISADITCNKRQYGKLEDCYPILPDAQGNEKIYKRACRKVQAFVTQNG